MKRLSPNKRGALKEGSYLPSCGPSLTSPRLEPAKVTPASLKSGLVIFDLDHTLFKVNSSFNFGLFLYRNQLISKWPLFLSLWHYLCHKWWATSMIDLHRHIFALLFRGRKMAEVQAQVSLFLTQSWEEMLNFPVFQELMAAKQRGAECALFSSAPSFMVEAVAQRLGISCWIATHYQVDASGCFTAVSAVVEGREKAKRLQKMAAERGVAQSDIVAYSDSYLDLPLLEAAGKPIAVAPDRKLKQICKQKGWRILSL